MAFGYTPGFGAYQPPQNGFNQFPTNFPAMQQNAPQPPAAAPQQGFSVHPVTSREEAMAVQADFFGLGTLLPSLAQGVIWLKRFNPQTGASDMLEFKLVQPMQIREAAPGKIDPIDFLRQLLSKVDELEKGVVIDVSNEQPGADVGSGNE